MKTFLLLDTVFQGGRNLFGAVFVPYLISRGVGLADVAILKLLQSSMMLVFEFPTGFVADHWGRRFCLLLSVAVGALTFWCFYSAHSFFDFAFAEILLALTLSLWSGAFDAYAIEHLKIENDKSLLHRFYHLRTSFVSIGVMFAGVVGGFLSSKSLNSPYLYSVGIFALIALWLIFFAPRDERHMAHSSVPKLVAFIRSSRGAAKTLTHKHLLNLTMSFIVLEVITQPLFFYWQAWFMNETSTNTVSLGFYYALFQIGLMSGGFLFASLSNRPWVQGPRFYSLSLLGFGLLNVLLVFVRGPISSLFIFLGIEILFCLGSSALKAELNSQLPNKERASFLSFVSMLAKAGGMITLLMIHSYLSGRLTTDSLAFVFGAVGIVGSLWFAGSWLGSVRPREEAGEVQRMC